eukprot:TRINITY_DN558_c0_g2_i1.p1 TRINITY_DN558_c0_g2~~TRINITY_DN558_c0_g2_i1.p1  ORF type:complete len:335 (+),score=49.32 TRINITY_DN558_c0_g2_i1:336-1340(+)
MDTNIDSISTNLDIESEHEDCPCGVAFADIDDSHQQTCFLYSIKDKVFTLQHKLQQAEATALEVSSTMERIHDYVHNNLDDWKYSRRKIGGFILKVYYEHGDYKLFREDINRLADFDVFVQKVKDHFNISSDHSVELYRPSSGLLFFGWDDLLKLDLCNREYLSLRIDETCNHDLDKIQIRVFFEHSREKLFFHFDLGQGTPILDAIIFCAICEEGVRIENDGTCSLIITGFKHLTSLISIHLNPGVSDGDILECIKMYWIVRDNTKLAIVKPSMMKKIMRRISYIKGKVSSRVKCALRSVDLFNDSSSEYFSDSSDEFYTHGLMEQMRHHLGM